MPVPATKIAVDVDSGRAQRGIAAGRASLLIAALALGIAMVVLVQQFSNSRHTSSTAPVLESVANVTRRPAERANRPPGAAFNRSDESSGAPSTGTAKQPLVIPTKTTEPPPPRDPKSALDEARRALWLVAVEEPKAHTAWPIAVAAAVRRRAALTSATVVVELKCFQAQGWKISLRRPGEERRIAISELRVHIGFASAPGDPATQIYDDFGLLTPDDDLDRLIALADDDERADIERGMPLTCLTIAFEWEPITKYQTYTPKTEQGKVFGVTLLEPDRRGSPRLIHASLHAPKKAYGSPVLNPAGHLIGIYAETVPQADGSAAPDPALQYVPLFDGRWLDSDLAASWLSPALNEPKSEKANQSEP